MTLAMKKSILSLLIFLLPFFAFAQQMLDECWSTTLPHVSSYAEKVHDMIWLRDGNIALVGEVQNPKEGTGGLFVLIDGKTGEEIERKVIQSIGNSALLSVVYGDYSFFAVGYKEVGKQKKQGWIVELDFDEEISILKDTTIGTSETDKFLEVVWTKNSTALIAGETDSDKGNLWLVNWDGQKALSDRTFGGKFIKSIVGMERGSRDRIWICGNTQKQRSRDINDNEAWWIQVDSEGRDKGYKILSSKSGKKLHCANRSLRGDIIMAGENWESPLGNGDAWLTEFDKKSNNVLDSLYGEQDTEVVTSIFKSPKGNYWSTVQYREIGFSRTVPSTFLYKWNDVSMEEPIFNKELHFTEGNYFEATRIVRTAENHYVLAGNISKAEGEPTQIQLTCLADSELMAAKSLDRKLENTVPVLKNREKTKILIPNQKAALKFELENTGDSDVPDGEIIVEEISMVNGVSILNKTQYFSYLAEGESEFYNIELKASGDVEIGKSEMLIKVLIKGKEIHRFRTSLGSGPRPKQVENSNNNGIKFDWVEPNVRTTLSTSKRVVENSQSIKIDVDSPNDLNLNDFKVTRNGKELIDNKSQNGKLSKPFMNKNTFQYTFEYVLDDKLEEGPNEIIVSLGEGKESIPIMIIYKPLQANLHVLAIGPSYTDLKFTTRDAERFSSELKNMQIGFSEDEKLFGHINVQTLVKPEETGMVKLLEKIEKFANNDSIKSNDFVIFYYSGHGIERNKKLRLCPTDYKTGALEARTTIDYKEEVFNPLSRIKAKTFIFIDACHSALAKSGVNPGDVGKATQDANQSAPGVMTITSCKEHEFSYEVQADENWQNGIFTRALIEAVRGDKVALSKKEHSTADLGYTDENDVLQDKAGNGIVSAGELIQFLEKRVKYLIEQQGNDKQTPSVPVEGLNRKIPLFIYGKN